MFLFIYYNTCGRPLSLNNQSIVVDQKQTDYDIQKNDLNLNDTQHSMVHENVNNYFNGNFKKQNYIVKTQNDYFDKEATKDK